MYLPGYHFSYLPGTDLMPIRASRTLALTLFMGWGMLQASLPAGAGSFEFPNPADGRTITVHYVMSADYDPHDPPVMVFHGMLRNPAEYRDAWIDLADKYRLFVVAPEFSREEFPGSAGYNLGNLFVSETDLTPLPQKDWSYPIPAALFDYLGRPDGETQAAGYLAFGHSAGSQFLHRMLALFPDNRLLLAVAANAGWYTFPSVDVRWPYGFGGTRCTETDLAAFLGRNLVVQLGDADVDPEHSGLRRTDEAMRQGPNRLERGENFFAAGKALAARQHTPFNWKLEIVHGVEHDNKAMAPFAAQLMADFIDKFRQLKPAKTATE